MPLRWTGNPRPAVLPLIPPIKIDGNFDDFYRTGCKPLRVLLDGNRLGEVMVGYDQKNLYLAYHVKESSGPQNAGSELPFAPFVSGAYVDVCLGVNWDGPRETVREGDVRVIFAQVKEGQGTNDFHVAFWPKKSGGKRPHTVQSPAAVETFDDVAAIEGAQIAWQIDKPQSQSDAIPYRVEASIPLAALGLTDPRGKTIGFDVSIGVANAAGDRRDCAAHWAGLSEGIVVDRPGSSKLLPRTWGMLEFSGGP